MKRSYDIKMFGFFVNVNVKVKVKFVVDVLSKWLRISMLDWVYFLLNISGQVSGFVSQSNYLISTPQFNVSNSRELIPLIDPAARLLTTMNQMSPSPKTDNLICSF
jgi:hypothetical protein